MKRKKGFFLNILNNQVKSKLLAEDVMLEESGSDWILTAWGEWHVCRMVVDRRGWEEEVREYLK